MAEELKGSLLMDASTFLAAAGSNAAPTRTVGFRHTLASLLTFKADRDYRIVYVSGVGAAANYCFSFDGTTAAEAAAQNRMLPEGIIAAGGAILPLQCNVLFKKDTTLYAASAGAVFTAVVLQIIE